MSTSTVKEAGSTPWLAPPSRMSPIIKLARTATTRTRAGTAASLIWLFTATGCFPASGADTSLKEIRTAEEVRRLSTQQADLHYPVRLRGVVTYYDVRIPTLAFRFIQDETAGIYFYEDGSTNNPPLRAGQLVEMEGETGAGSFAPVVTSHRIRILGEAALPAARPVNFEQLASGLEDSQFVEISGVVRSVRLEETSSNYVIELATGQGRLTVLANQLPVARSEELVDSTVRTKGVCITRFNSQRQLFDSWLLVPLPEDLVIEQPAPGDAESLPEQPIKSLMQYTWGGTYGHRVKVTGTVTLRYSNKMYVQDETEGLCVETRQTDSVPVGERVEVLGFPAKGEYTPLLQDGTYHRIARGPDLKPDIITPDAALTGAHDCRLVQIQATLLDRAEHSKEPFLVLQANGFVFHAYLKSQQQYLDFGNLQNGSKLLVTGVCVIDDLGENWNSSREWRAASFRLLLRSPADVAIVQQPPWWTLKKLVLALAILGVVLLSAFAWVGLLRRRVGQQTQIIEEKLAAEAALKERYLDLFENANDMVFTHDLAGHMTSINKAGERLLQYERSQILARDLTDLITEEQRTAARDWLKQVATGVEVPAVDWDFVNASGQKLKLEVSSRIVEQAGRFIEVEGIARDVTARKRMEKEILEISNREQQRMGHDLHDGVCQQLAAIAYRTHVLARHLKENNAADSLEASEISSLINDSLVQTRSVARGLFPVRLEEEGLTEAVEELTAGVSRLYKIKCDFSSSGAFPTIHNGVAMHLHFIAQEAILNAAKHSQAGSIAVRLEKDNEDLVLTVQDDGIGFHASATDKAGMGIGIMRYRAKVIGAVLELSSEPGRGTRVTCKYHLMT